MTIYKKEGILVEKIDEYGFGEVYLISRDATSLHEVTLIDEDYNTIKSIKERDVDLAIDKFYKWLKKGFKEFRRLKDKDETKGK